MKLRPWSIQSCRLRWIATLRAAFFAGAMLGLSGCGVVSRAPELGASAVRAANPKNWFGGKDKDESGKTKAKGEDGAAESEGSATSVATPGSATLGTVHMVDRRNDFILILSSRLTKVDYGTPAITLDAKGQQTSELKMSPERNGQFLVADIERGNPDVGDVVKLVGMRDETGGIVPAGSDEVQVLE